MPSAGDIFERVMNDKEARRISEERKLAVAVAAHQPPRPKMSLEDFFARMEGEGIKTLNIIVRADMQGTLEPVLNSLNELTNDEVQVKILAASIGDISESDVMLAEASDAVSTAKWIRRILDKQVPLPKPLANQLACASCRSISAWRDGKL